MSIEKLAIVGVGLIGGSLALSLRHHSNVKYITGLGRNEDILRGAQRAGIIDGYAMDWSAVRECEVIVLAVPVGQTYDVLRHIRPHLGPDITITDVGSVKGAVIDAAQKALVDQIQQFIPAHPIAGSEKQGYLAATPHLFEQKRVIVTPLESNDTSRIELIESMWHACGAITERMTPEHHDHVFSIVSHLPHLLAFALMNDASEQLSPELLLKQAGSGFRDFTRIAASSPEMWRDIFLANRGPLLAALEEFQSQLEGYQQMIAQNDAEALAHHLNKARELRQCFATLNISHKR